MFNIVSEFEKKLADFFGSPYAVAVDCCTHGLELCLRFSQVQSINVPRRTYVSIPLLADKLNIKRTWKDENWKDYYYLTESVSRWKIIDAAVLWEKNSYITGTYMCISFQFQKHLSLGRGGVILTDSKSSAEELKKMSYDGRIPNVPWREQNIKTRGYHYYMTPETAQQGLDRLPTAIERPPREWVVDDWPDLTKMDVFNSSPYN
jgi:dTDP-4-amino-4,6-dideoxygalactose transaminase|tara:strand:+ start:862 stop:1476 length:615 start_codon:yes stop_codon:yes gene_type:complete